MPRHRLRLPDGGALLLGPRPLVMGILNVTPDSFSDGGQFCDVDRAVARALEMCRQGADIIDVGGESTRPDAEPVDPGREIERVLPVIEGIKRAHDVRVSVDTMKAGVARQALDAGADMINDVTAIHDPAMLSLICERRVPVVLMHMRGTPRTMQRRTDYEDVAEEVATFLQERVDIAVAAGVKDGKILVDPGIGFGKSTTGNLSILKQLPTLVRAGRPILLGASRKTFIGKTLGLPVNERLEGSLAVAAYGSARGAHVIRAHDVAATVRVVRMIDAIRNV